MLPSVEGHQVREPGQPVKSKFVEANGNIVLILRLSRTLAGCAEAVYRFTTHPPKASRRAKSWNDCAPFRQCLRKVKEMTSYQPAGCWSLQRSVSEHSNYSRYYRRYLIKTTFKSETHLVQWFTAAELGVLAFYCPAWLQVRPVSLG